MSEPFVIEQKQADSSYKQLIPLGYINQNLADNTNFFNIINQQSLSSYSGGGVAKYSIDRWKIDGAVGSINVTSNGLLCSRGATSNQYLYQYIEASKKHVASGEILTLSVKTTVGKYVATGALSTSTVETTTPFGRIMFSLLSNGYIQLLLDFSSDSVTFEWVKLEKGAVPTPYVPKGYGIELTECLRYYQRVFFAMRMSNNTVGITFNPPMRVAPTLSFTSYTGNKTPTPLSVGIYGGWLSIPAEVNYYTGYVIASADL